MCVHVWCGERFEFGYGLGLFGLGFASSTAPDGEDATGDKENKQHGSYVGNGPCWSRSEGTTITKLVLTTSNNSDDERRELEALPALQLAS